MGFNLFQPIQGLFDDGQDEVDAIKGLNAENKQYYNDIGEPILSSDMYIPEEYRYSLIEEDPALLDAQMSALNKLSGLQESGLMAEDRLGFENARMNAAKMASQSRGAAMDSAAARGVGGSGLEFATGEIAAQEAAERTRRSSMEQAAETARGRALYNQAYGEGLGNVRTQNYNTQAANTGVMNQFNQMNTQGRNEAQQYNQTNHNAVAQEKFNNKLRIADGKAGVNREMQNVYAAQNAANASQRNALLGAGAQVGAAAIASDERVKQNISSINKEDLKELRKVIRPYTFNYKSSEHGDGDWAGVMAQDLEKSKLGRMVVEKDSSGVKHINAKKLLSLLLATLAEA